MPSPSANPPPLADSAQAVEQAVAALDAGELVVIPTETVYGLACRADRPDAVDRLRREVSGGRPAVYSVHLPDPIGVWDYLHLDDPAAHRAVDRLVTKGMPGPITLQVEQDRDATAQRLDQAGVAPSALDAIQAEDGPIGLRCPDHGLARRVLRGADGPVVAGRAGRKAYDVQRAQRSVGESAAVVLDGGPSRYARGSTVVRVDGRGAVRVEREGVLDQRMIQNMQQYTILMVCTGNTCRSPMAEAIARQVLAQAKGVAESELAGAGVTVGSAGAFAMAGGRASPEAVDAMREQGMDLSTHRSRPLTRDLVGRADVIYTMTASHREAVLDLAPEARAKVHPLDPDADIEDPMGADAQAYVQTAGQIRRALEHRLKEHRA